MQALCLTPPKNMLFWPGWGVLVQFKPWAGLQIKKIKHSIFARMQKPFNFLSDDPPRKIKTFKIVWGSAAN